MNDLRVHESLKGNIAYKLKILQKEHVQCHSVAAFAQNPRKSKKRGDVEDEVAFCLDHNNCYLDACASKFSRGQLLS